MQGGELLFVAVVGSVRRHSAALAIANTLDELAPDNMQVVVLPSIADLPIYNQDLQDVGLPDAVETMSKAIAKADGVVIVTPEYHRSIPGALKNALDWIGRLPEQALAGKPVAIQTVSADMLGGICAQSHLREILASMDAHVLGKPEVIVPRVVVKVDDETCTLRDEDTRQEVVVQLAALAEMTRRLADQADDGVPTPLVLEGR